MQKKIIDVAYNLEEMDFLIKCPIRPGGVVQNTLDWMPNLVWDSIQSLSSLEEFSNFAHQVEKEAPTRFKDWYNELAPEDQKLPLEWKRLDSTPFKKLLVIRCLRPDRMTIALVNFIK